MLLIQYTFIYSAVLIVVALGGMFSERSGVVNLGLEGTMVFGALGGAFVLFALPPGTNPALVVALSIFASIVVGMLFSLLLAVAAINFRADQTLVGTAMNMLATAAATVIVKSFNSARTNGSHPSATLSYLENRSCFVMFKIGDHEFSLYIVVAIILLAVAFVLLYKTKFGLRLASCGEHPQAADSVGINVYKMRYAGVLISGFCGGIGGLIYVSAVNSQWDFAYGVAGAGFLSLAVMIFGQWNPLRIAVVALFFGLLRAVADSYTAFDMLIRLVPGDFYKMLPYIISLIVLAFTSKKSRSPKAAGIPYDKGTR